jgi:dTMP kinase
MTQANQLAGRFIVVDGPDGAGKSTQVRLLAEHLRGQGLPVLTVRDPGGTAIGDRIREILLDNAHGEMAVECELMLYMASRAQLVAQTIAPALRAGQCVLSDRYVSSTIAYQGAGGADVRAIRAVAHAAVGDTWPDLTVILDLPSEVGLTRLKGTPDRMEAKAADFHRKVREMFLRQAQDDPARCAVVDAAGTVEQVQQRLRDTVDAWRFAKADA